jgi:arsenite methyltransferase
MRRLVPLVLALPLLLSCGSWKRFLYEGLDRDDWQQPDRVIAELGIRPGDHVADIGAGGGYFTFRLAEAVGPEGMVYAVDVDEDMTRLLEERVAEEGHANVKVILGKFEDPLLPDGKIGLVFTCNTYHHIEERPAYFRGVLADLEPEGRVAILELNATSWFPRTFGHHTERDVIVSEMEEAGYALEDEFDFVDRQHFATFRRDDR